MELKEIFVSIPKSEAVLRIYRNYLCLNSSAVTLLGLDGTGYIKVSNSQDDLSAGRFRCYIAKVNNTAITSFAYRKRGNTAIVSSRPLAGFLAKNLDGYGTYRICPDDNFFDGQVNWYNIFFVNYDKKDSIRRYQ